MDTDELIDALRQLAFGRRIDLSCGIPSRIQAESHSHRLSLVGSAHVVGVLDSLEAALSSLLRRRSVCDVDSALATHSSSNDGGGSLPESVSGAPMIIHLMGGDTSGIFEAQKRTLRPAAGSSRIVADRSCEHYCALQNNYVRMFFLTTINWPVTSHNAASGKMSFLLGDITSHLI